MASLKDVIIDPLTYKLLKENGKIDCERGIPIYQGWKDLRELAGYSPGRTPASEAYEDGYYSGTPSKK